MRRTAALLTGMVLALVAPIPAGAYVDIGYDSSDQTGTYDIRFTVRRLGHGGHGGMLKLSVEIYEGQPPLDQLDYVWRIDVRLDVRGGRAADAVLHLWSEDMSGSGCELRTRRGLLIRRGSLGTGVTVARCRVPVHRIHPSKRIRWSVAMSDDEAPDVGMYS